MIKKYILYWWVGGFRDSHVKEGEFNTLSELVDYHAKYRPNHSLYNDKNVGIGEDYYQIIVICVHKTKNCVYKGGI